MFNTAGSLDVADAPALRSVLIIDDSEFDRMRFKRECRRFSDARIQLDECGSLGEFKVRLDAKQYDLMVVDYALPDGEGFAACDMCRASQRNSMVPMVLVTGYARGAVEDQALALGFSEVVSKDRFEFASVFKRHLL